MRLIVGLGNPGKEYDMTRHNVGFEVLDKLAKKHQIEFTKTKFNGLYCEFKKNLETIILLKPLSYMNLSGEVIKKFMTYYHINIDDLLVIHDDLDIELGYFKMKDKGSSGGHNGLKNIEDQLNTQDYKRIKIGISNNKQIDTKNYVLGKFSKEEQEKLSLVIDKVIEIIEESLECDFYKLMSKYNIKNRS